MPISWLRRFWTPAHTAVVIALAALPLSLASSPYYLFLLNTIAVFAMLALGGVIHLLMDMIKDILGSGAVHPFLPFSTFSVEFGWIDPENVILLVPLDAALLGALLFYERRRDRVRQ